MVEQTKEISLNGNSPATDTSPLAVRCSNVCKTYTQGQSEIKALDEVSLDVNAGAFISLCGPSGSGKTTLLNLIGSLDLPDRGNILIDGQLISSLSETQRAELRLNHIGFVFQSYNLIPVLTAKENVEFIMQLQGIDAKSRSESALEILDEVGLGGMENRRPGELSGGQQQRVAVARAIVSKPKIVLADEPTANLDSKTAGKLLELMKELNDRLGLTFVFSTHDSVVMEYAEKVIMLKDGKVVS